MKRILLLAVFVLLLTVLPGVSAAETAAPVPPEGFGALFNGRDFTHWRGYRGEEWKKHWRIEGGVLKSHTSLSGGGGPAGMRTVNEYGDFVLMLEFRLPDSHSDSGILTRLGQVNLMPSVWGPVGLEVHGKPWSDEDRRRWRKVHSRPPNFREDKGVGRWHHLVLTLEGDTVSAELNGEPYVDSFRIPGDHPESGPIGLQKHPDKPDYSGKTDSTYKCAIEYRNLFIKELPRAQRPLNNPPEGFTALFNGKDLSGWTVSGQWRQPGMEVWQDHWEIQHGVLKTSTEAEHTHLLLTEQEFKDFVFRIDYRLPLDEKESGNSGVMLHGKGFLQVDFGKGRRGSGALEHYATPYGKDPYPEEVRKKATPPMKFDKPARLWNTLEITLRGNRVTVKVNGHVTIDNFKLLDYEPGPEGGPIGLQKHTNQHGWGGPMEFRNIFIRELPDEQQVVSKPPEGFTALFNGGDLSDWYGDRESDTAGKETIWRAEDGVIRFYGPGDAHWENKDAGSLIHKRRFGHSFVLMADWRMVSPVPTALMFSTVSGRGSWLGFAHVEVSARAPICGGIGNMERPEDLPPIDWSPEWLASTPGPYKSHMAHIPTENAGRGLGEWNHFVVTVKRDLVTVELNGTTVLKDARLSRYADEVAVGLQNHGGPEGKVLVEWRNIFIKELEAE